MVDSVEFALFLSH